MSLHRAMNLSAVDADAETEARRNEFFATPSEVTRAFLQVEGDRLREYSKVWEPACGDGAMVRELTAAGYDVVSTDLVDRGGAARLLDFYSAVDRLAPAMVTNPPFSQCSSDGKMRWIKHAIDLGVEYMALLLPSAWPYAQERREVLRRWPLAREHKVGWRIDWTGDKQSPASHSWFVWERGAEAATWQTGVVYRDELTVHPDLFEALTP